jgi:hypothetical protein
MEDYKRYVKKGKIIVKVVEILKEYLNNNGKGLSFHVSG